MPKFFFHVHDDDVTIDHEGTNLADLEAARERAVREARQLACHEVLEGHLSLGHRIEVNDESGATVALVEFREAIEVH